MGIQVEESKDGRGKAPGMGELGEIHDELWEIDMGWEGK